MAIDPGTEYSGQVDSDAAYPLGKPRNRSSQGATDGTPLEELWVQDLFGLFQALLDYDVAAPTGTPDSADDSQFFDAIYGLARLVKATETLEVAANGSLDLLSYATAAIKAYSTMTVEQDGTLRVLSGGFLDVLAGAFATVNGKLSIGSSGRLKTQPIFYGASEFLSDGNWDNLDGIHTWRQTDAGYPVSLSKALSLPYGTIVSGMELWVDGGSGSEHSVVPQHQPSVSIQRYTLTDGASGIGSATSLASVEGNKTTVADYEELHSISTSTSVTITPGYMYQLLVVGEYGTGALNQALNVYGVKLSFN